MPLNPNVLKAPVKDNRTDAEQQDYVYTITCFIRQK
jgi:hypothetical protein